MAKKYNATPEEISFYEDENLEFNPSVDAARPAFEEQPINANVDASVYETSDGQPLPENLPWYQSIPAAAAKGLAKGISNFGRSLGGLQTDEALINRPNSESSYLQRFLGSRQAENPLENFLDKQIPSNPNFIEGALDRAGQILPLLLANPLAPIGTSSAGAALSEGSTLSSGALKQVLGENAQTFLGSAVRSGLAGVSGETAKELGAPDWLQSLAEIPAQAIPSFGSRIIPTQNQSALVNQARNLGLTESQIAPVIQDLSSRATRVISKIANKKGRAESALKDSYDAIGRVYNNLSSRPDALKPFTAEQWYKTASELESSLQKMPAGLRNLVKEDLADLLNGEMTGQKLINFYQDTNYYIGKGERQLGLLKEPITRALSQSGSPQLAKDFLTTNKLASNYFSIASKLKPSVADDLINASEGVRVLYGAFTGNYPLLLETIGETASRQMATELLVNPRFQNLSRQMVQALNTNKFPAAVRIYDSMLNVAREVDPQSAVFLQTANLSNLENNRGKEE